MCEEGWDCGDLGVPYLDKTSALLISINLWALQIYPHLSGLAPSLQESWISARHSRETSLREEMSEDWNNGAFGDKP